jgi:predicted ribosomally synthesized peptide with nif11-like leader
MADVSQFISKVSADADFRASLQNASAEERHEILSQAGFGDLTREQVESYSSGSAELSDSELEAVAGGQTSTWVAIAVALAVAA